MYKICWLCAILLFLTGGVTLAQSYGLSFNSHDVVQEKRTSLDLSPGDSICFEKKMTLEFDMHLMPNKEVYFGYLVRIINGSQNIDIICSQQQFKVVSGQQLTNIAFAIDTAALYNTWNRFSLAIDPATQRLQFALNGKTIGQCDVHLTGNCYRFLWGANDDQRFNTRDIPPMRIHDIKLLNGAKVKYHWVLTDTSGLTSTDLISRRQAKAKNPVWIKPRHQHWQLVTSFTLSGIAGAAFDSKNDHLLITGADSVWTYRPGMERNALQAQPNKQVNLLTGHQAIWDTMHNALYDIYVDQKKVMLYDAQRKEWSSTFRDTLLTEFWHANKFISPIDTAIYIIGGYGQLKYRNGVLRYQLTSGTWDSIKTTGDPFPPRYLAALGANAKGDTAYIIGGYGSVTGDQMLNPGNYYDLYTFDVKRHAFAKRYSFKPTGQHFVFANSLVIPPSGNQYYALIFANGSFNTSLQLVQGGLHDSTMRLVGDAIPYSFYDIRSFADLFYASRSHKLLAVTFFYSGENEKEKTTQVKIWSIDFPPESFDAPLIADEKPVSKYLWWLLALVPVAVAFVWWRNKRNRRTSPMGTVAPGIGTVTIPPATMASVASQPPVALQPQHIPVTPISTHPAIRLFGQFQVTDAAGTDITKLFTPLLKELFLLILVYTVRNNRGISSETLNEILWHDKPVKDAKNNRSVNLAKLKPILEKVGPCVINKDTGAWEVHCADDSVWIDYQVFTHLLQEPGQPDKTYMRRLLQIIERGPFLQQTEYNWLDDIKSEVSTNVLTRCLQFTGATHATEDPEFIIEICNTIFLFDRLNEDALHYKCQRLISLKRHALANTTYLSFTKEYKEIYGEDFPRSFNEIIK